jgi:HTH-type transcriptional regulator / antitoxin HigA
MIQLSLLGKTNDKFWFTFFHEAAHILLHAGSTEDKKSIFLDDPSGALHPTDPNEQQANDWATNFLVPPQHKGILPNLRTKALVVDFARHIDVHPGIVVGRLQHEQLIPPDWMNDLKQSLRFKSPAGH